eukprot:1145341-Pelagomonas_calceolata.AAC.1
MPEVVMLSGRAVSAVRMPEVVMLSGRAVSAVRMPEVVMLSVTLNIHEHPVEALSKIPKGYQSTLLRVIMTNPRSRPPYQAHADEHFAMHQLLDLA